MVYSSSQDALSKGITVFCFVLFLCLGCLNFFSISGKDLQPMEVLLRISPVVLLTIVFLLCYALSPRGYKIDGDSMIILRSFKPVQIMLADIKSVRSIEQKSLGVLIRTFGVGGLFGYFGKHYSSTIGKVQLYTRQRKNLILIETIAGLKLIISPDEPELLLRAIERSQVQSIAEN